MTRTSALLLAPLAVLVVVIVGAVAWKHRPETDVGHLHDWLLASGCASVTTRRFGPSLGKDHDVFSHRLISAGTRGEFLDCNNISGSLELVRFASRPALRAALAHDPETQGYAYCVVRDTVITEHLLGGDSPSNQGGDHHSDFRDWCGRLDGAYHPHARRQT